MTHEELEEGAVLALDFNKLQKIGATNVEAVPVVVQHADTREVLIVAYANAKALEETRKRNVAVFWSTSRNELWVKGETSGDVLDLVEIRVNCEQNSLLYLVRPRAGGVCHTRNAAGKHRTTCYYRRLNAEGGLESVTE